MDQSPLLRGFPVAEPRLLLSCRHGSEGMLSHCFTSRDPGHQWEITMASATLLSGCRFQQRGTVCGVGSEVSVPCLCCSFAGRRLGIMECLT